MRYDMSATTDAPRQKLSPRTAKPTRVPPGDVEFQNLVPRHPHHRRQHGLSDPSTPLDPERFASGIQHDHLNFAPVILIDRSWAVRQNDPIP
jgi:hypothetical protein